MSNLSRYERVRRWCVESLILVRRYQVVATPVGATDYADHLEELERVIEFRARAVARHLAIDELGVDAPRILFERRADLLAAELLQEVDRCGR